MQGQDLALANASKPPFVNIGKSSHLANGFATDLDDENENPGALAGASGANVDRAVIKPKLYQIAAGLATFAGVMA